MKYTMTNAELQTAINAWMDYNKAIPPVPIWPDPRCTDPPLPHPFDFLANEQCRRAVETMAEANEMIPQRQV